MNFIAKQALGGAVGDLKSAVGNEKKEVDPEEAKRRAETQEALAEQEAERKAKHAIFEQGREGTRSGIRAKYNLKSPEQKAAEQAEEQANDPMAAIMADMQGGNKKTKEKEIEYDDDIMGQAQQAFDVSKAKAAEMAGPLLDKAPDVVKDNCKQQ